MKRDFSEQKKVLPEYPSTPHLPWKCTGKGVQVSEAEAGMLWTSDNVIVEEKIDGANVGMALYDGHPIIRNRDFILTKGYKKDTPAKIQFRPTWGWFYEHKKCFEKLNEYGPYSVYGDWMYMAHGLKYDLLPSLYMTYDIYDYDQGKFLASPQARLLLATCGFKVIHYCHLGRLENWEQLEIMANWVTPYATNARQEGVYVKVYDENWITHRFKMVREGFVQGEFFTDTIVRNQVVEA